MNDDLSFESLIDALLLSRRELDYARMISWSKLTILIQVAERAGGEASVEVKQEVRRSIRLDRGEEEGKAGLESFSENSEKYPSYWRVMPVFC